MFHRNKTKTKQVPYGILFPFQFKKRVRAIPPLEDLGCAGSVYKPRSLLVPSRNCRHSGASMESYIDSSCATLPFLPVRPVIISKGYRVDVESRHYQMSEELVVGQRGFQPSMAVRRLWRE